MREPKQSIHDISLYTAFEQSRKAVSKYNQFLFLDCLMCLCQNIRKWNYAINTIYEISFLFIYANKLIWAMRNLILCYHNKDVIQKYYLASLHRIQYYNYLTFAKSVFDTQLVLPLSCLTWSNSKGLLAKNRFSQWGIYCLVFLDWIKSHRIN